jgi:hypothetical protein
VLQVCRGRTGWGRGGPQGQLLSYAAVLHGPAQQSLDRVWCQSSKPLGALSATMLQELTGRGGCVGSCCMRLDSTLEQWEAGCDWELCLLRLCCSSLQGGGP